MLLHSLTREIYCSMNQLSLNKHQAVTQQGEEDTVE